MMERHNYMDSNFPSLESYLLNDRALKEQRTYHRRGQRFKSSTAHHGL